MRARLKCRDAIVDAMDAGPYKADVVGAQLGTCADVAYDWRRPSKASLPATEKFWRMLTEPGVLGDAGRRALVRELARAGGFEVVFPGDVGLEREAAAARVLELQAELGEVAKATRAAGEKVDTPEEAAAVLAPVRKVIEDARELEASLVKVAG